MCGIAGIVGTSTSIDQALCRASEIQSHRGPDAHGTLLIKHNQWSIGLAHQRLSIIDLTSAANQPMTGNNGDIIVFNGEIYNYRELRSDLVKNGYQFKTDSDTEVILAAVECWGLIDALNRFNGMWAFAYFIFNENKIILARDRFGKKPLHYFHSENNIYFSSELKGILAMANRSFKLNTQVINEYVSQSLLDAGDCTFFKGINKIPAAHIGVIDLNASNLSIRLIKYWALSDKQCSVSSDSDLISSIRDLFFDSVRLRLRSDVPVGVLLSGGIDSSSIAAAMNHLNGTGENLNLLSAVSNDSRFDESPFIDRVARHLNSKVNKVFLNFQPDQAFDLLEKVCWHNDEPVGSFSNVAHYLLMEKARELGITVILTGQGADELLCGYRKYLGFYLQKMVKEYDFINAVRIFREFQKQGTILNQFNFADAKRYLPKFLRSKEIDIRGKWLKDSSLVHLGMNGCSTVMERQRLDLERFSVPALLHYEDRMSMACSREIRVPFLDYRLVELFISLPMKYKLNDGWTKYIFRKAIEPYLPSEIVWRKDKMGFDNPEYKWLQNELSFKVSDYFSKDSLIFKNEIINHRGLNEKYSLFRRQDPIKGTVSVRDIFNPLALEVWMRRYIQYISI